MTSPAEPPAEPPTGTGPGGPGSRRQPLSQIGSDPDYRFTLANERTFLSWIRTSLALIAGGVAVVQFAPSLGERWIRLVLGVALILLSVLMAAASHRRWYVNERAMRLGEALRPTPMALVLAYGVTVVGVAVLVVLLLAGG